MQQCMEQNRQKTKMEKQKMDGYDPILLTKTTEEVVIDGNKRKYARLARSLRFYGGTTSAKPLPKRIVSDEEDGTMVST